ncbi:MAG TPA: cyclic pyranopterin monophosphate synthase MoaC [Myxococcota bacterium]
MSSPRLSHVDDTGAVSMVDVSNKPSNARHAIASALLRCTPSTRDALLGGRLHKGEAIVTAKVAGVLAAKKTGELIPLCHPLALSDVQIAVVAVDDGLAITATARCVGPTGVEMEALTAAAVCGLTLYDMGKAVERGMRLDAVRLVEKAGGRSGTWRADDDDDDHRTLSG